jgi:hypothetical protein
LDSTRSEVLEKPSVLEYCRWRATGQPIFDYGRKRSRPISTLVWRGETSEGIMTKKFTGMHRKQVRAIILETILLP